MVSGTIANALISSSRSRRSGSAVRISAIPIPKRRSLVSRKLGSMVQRLAWRPGGRLGVTGRQAPRILHVARMYTYHGTELIGVRDGDAGAAELARPACWAALAPGRLAQVSTRRCKICCWRPVL